MLCGPTNRKCEAVSRMRTVNFPACSNSLWFGARSPRGAQKFALMPAIVERDRKRSLSVIVLFVIQSVYWNYCWPNRNISIHFWCGCVQIMITVVDSWPSSIVRSLETTPIHVSKRILCDYCQGYKKARERERVCLGMDRLRSIRFDLFSDDYLWTQKRIISFGLFC